MEQGRENQRLYHLSYCQVCSVINDWFRRERTQRAIPFSDFRVGESTDDIGLSELIADQALGPEEQVVYQDMVNRGLAGRSPDDRKALHLAAKGFSYEEISQELGGSPNAHKLRVFRTRRMMKQMRVDL